MTKLRLQILPAAAADVLEQAEWYATTANTELAMRWQRAVTATILDILDFPRAAPACYFSSVEFQDIRRAPVRDFSRHLVFYRATDTVLLVVRVLHGARDFESLFPSTANP